ncbi:unnamed protein product [Adineta steineri]|uniref:Uncharacterized protein n=1 Tax=Adineta steineri TaxID=433720 RepID=A0A814H3J2_9BILA|nr:unnamed protein product [Adineta steineri]CAF1005168.1 unnamed protein product [Adineta steineri]CAF1075390.1 unnamed protein product [Adineta steineri]
MASLRLKVQLGDEKKIYARGKPLFRKFIYSIDSSSNETIGELIRKLQDYINKHFSHFNIRLVQLMTHDGFILSKSDLYSSVLKDNDHIICIDMRRFIDEYFICFEDNTLWLERKQYDATNNKEKFIRIGLNNVSELFIRLFGTVNVSGLYIFGIYELIKIANEKSADKLIARLDGTMDSDQSTSADWFLECWRECQDVAIAPIPIRNEEPRWLTESVINIQPDKLISFTIRGTLRVKGDIGLDNAARERMHRSLPQPFKFKIVVTDSSGKQCSLIIEQLNKPLDPLTRESFIYDEKSNIGEFLAFTYADDVEQEKRLYAGIFINKLGELVVKISGSYTGAYDRKIIRAMQYHAKQNKTPEVDLDGTTYDLYDTHGRAIAIFDPETYMFYAVRLELTTKTSKTVETVLIPVEKIKSTD